MRAACGAARLATRVARQYPLFADLEAESSTDPASSRRVVMPVYEYHCDKCRREVAVTQSISEHGKGTVACPKCGSTALRPLVSSFFTQTSRKS